MADTGDIEFNGWQPLGDGFSLDAGAEHELPGAFVRPRADGTWRWEAGFKNMDGWFTPLGFGAGKANTAAEAKATAEAWLRSR